MFFFKYYDYKLELVDVLKEIFNSLNLRYDIVVMEGVGSNVEINLKDRDIFNMGMVEIVDVFVIIVGDIDRGGVFVLLVGIMFLLNEDEKRRVKGVIINKFRGKKEFL